MSDMALAPLQHRPLGRSGISIPILGIGCSDFGNRARRLPPRQVDDAIASAMAHDIRYFDTAPYYGFGLSERRVGDALRGYDRQSYLLSSKVGRRLVPDGSIDTSEPRNGFHSAMPFRPEFDYSYDGVMRSWEASLQRIGLARIDILFVHDIGAFAHGDDHDRTFREFADGGLRALQELRQAGEIGAFGLGVNECAICEQVMDLAEVDCFLLAGRYTLLEQGAADRLLPRCAAAGTSIIIGGPYNTGLLAGGTRRTGALRYDYGPAPEGILKRVRELEAVCDTFGVPLAAAALQFPLGHPSVAAVLPGVGSAERVAETRSLLDFPIPQGFWISLRGKGLVADQAPLPSE
jgi:D-threo-aldose 1-dehydrogenase